MQIADIAGPFLKKGDRKKRTVLRREGNNTSFALAKDLLFLPNQELVCNGKFRVIYIFTTHFFNIIRYYAPSHWSTVVLR